MNYSLCIFCIIYYVFLKNSHIMCRCLITAATKSFFSWKYSQNLQIREVSRCNQKVLRLFPLRAEAGIQQQAINMCETCCCAFVIQPRSRISTVLRISVLSPRTNQPSRSGSSPVTGVEDPETKQQWKS